MKDTSLSDRLYLEHMRECMERVAEYAEGDRDRFMNSRLVQDAVLRNQQTLAESSQKLSDSVKQQAPDIPWKAIAGFRNVLVHDYLGVDPVAVWRVIEFELPRLKTVVLRLLALLSNIEPKDDRHE